MKILSLFDGISCGYVACQRAGIEINKYWASEIDDYSVSVSRYNFPDIEHIGDVHNVRALNPDLLIGGSPCQGFSFAGKGLDFDDKRSALFFEYHKLLIRLKPKYFLFENVPMKNSSRDIITTLLGVEPIEINSALVSAQNRRRLYWTNIPVTQPVDKKINLNSITYGSLIDMAWVGGRLVNRRINEKGKRDDYNKNIPPISYTETRADDKMNCITTVNKDTVLVHPNFAGRIQEEKSVYRHLIPLEYERLQTLPDGYTKYGFFRHNDIRRVSKSRRHKLIGNGWTVDVIAHILKGIKGEDVEFYTPR